MGFNPWIKVQHGWEKSPGGHGVAVCCAKSQNVRALAVADWVAASTGATDTGEGPKRIAGWGDGISASERGIHQKKKQWGKLTGDG